MQMDLQHQDNSELLLYEMGRTKDEWISSCISIASSVNLINGSPMNEFSVTEGMQKLLSRETVGQLFYSSFPKCHVVFHSQVAYIQFSHRIIKLYLN